VHDVFGGTDPIDVERQAGDAVEDAFACTERDRHDVQAQLVDRAEREVLVEGRPATLGPRERWGRCLR
jgi:hypothetical protein